MADMLGMEKIWENWISMAHHKIKCTFKNGYQHIPGTVVRIWQPSWIGHPRHQNGIPGIILRLHSEPTSTSKSWSLSHVSHTIYKGEIYSMLDVNLLPALVVMEEVSSLPKARTPRTQQWIRWDGIRSESLSLASKETLHHSNASIPQASISPPQ